VSDAASKYAPLPGKIPGTVMNLGGHDLVLAPLNLDGTQIVEPLLEQFNTATGSKEVATLAAKIVHVSLVRNYPDITEEEVLALLDLGNMQSAVLKVCSVSGMEFAKPGENPPTAR
jgi:hypothetical protein